MDRLRAAEPGREGAYGRDSLSLVDKVGVFLSQRAILRHLPRRTDLVVLDIGCGYRALHLVRLAPRMAEGTGIDMSVDPSLKQVPGLNFVEGPVEMALPHLADGSYDLALMISVLEHLEDPLEALRQCFRLLRPGGRLLVNVPSWRGKLFLELAAFRLGVSAAEEMNDHKMYYDLPDLWPLLVKAGFRPGSIHLHYHKLGLNLFGVVDK